MPADPANVELVAEERTTTASSSTQIPAAGRRMAVLLYLLFLITSATQTAIVPLLPRLSNHYGLSTAAMAALLAAPALATLIVSLPAAAIADRFGARRVTLLAGTVLVVSAAAQASPSYLALVAGRLAFGVAFGTVWTTGVAWLAEREPEAGSARLGALVTSGAIGLVLGPELGGVLGDTVGLSAPFLAVAMFALATVALLSREPGGSGRERARYSRITRQIPAAARQPAVMSSAAALGVAGAFGGVLQLLVPLQLHRSGASASVVGLAFSGAAACYILVSSGVVGAARFMTTVRVIALGALALALSLVPAVVGTVGIALVVVLLVAAAPRALVSTIAYPLATRSSAAADLGDGVVIGLLNSVWGASQVAIPLLAGVLVQVGGPQIAYLAAVVPGAAVSAWLLGRHLRQRPEAPALRIRSG